MMELLPNKSSAWLTLNRACNLRCRWCYGAASDFSNDSMMSLDDANRYLEYARSCGVRGVVLIGGEPTLHSELPSIIDTAHRYEMRVSLVSNGISFADEKRRKEIVRRLTSDDVINISIKGTTLEHYETLCSCGDAFEMVMEGIQALSSIIGPNVSLSYVVSKDNIDSLENTLFAIRKFSDLPLGLSFCGPCFNGKEFAGKELLEARATIANKCLELLGKISIANISLHLNLPVCKIDTAALSQALRGCEIRTGCHVLNHSGVIFDTNGDLLLCNHLLGLPIGCYGHDYLATDDFKDFVSSKQYSEAWQALTRLPFESCESCESLRMCGGGCPLLFY